MDAGGAETQRWWTRDLPDWVESALWGALFAVGLSALVGVSIIPLYSVNPPLIALSVATTFAAAVSAFVWFFSPMYTLRDQHLAIDRELNKDEARATRRLRELAVGHSLVQPPLFATLAALYVNAALITSTFSSVVTWQALLLTGFFLGVASAWGASISDPLSRVWPLWRLRMRRNTTPDEPVIASQDVRPRGRLAGAMIGIALLLVSIAPATAIAGAEAMRTAKVLGITRMFDAGAEIELVDGTRLTVPDGWSAIVTTGGSDNESVKSRQQATLSSPNDQEFVTVLVSPRGPAGVYDPLKMAQSARAEGLSDWTVGSIDTMGWSGSAYMWETAPNTWKTAAPERMLIARLTRAKRQTVELSISWSPESQLQSITNPSVITQTVIGTLQLKPDVD